MPSPTAALATQRPDLAASFEEFSLEADRLNFIGHRVFPVLDVAKQAGNFGRIPVEQLLQHPETIRAPGSGYNRRDWKFTPDTYATTEHGLEEPVDDRESEMYADYFDAELVGAQRAMDGVLRAAEKRIADAVFNATTFTPNAVVNEWDDAVNATPITDIEAGVQAFYLASGLWPNALIINRLVFRNLRNVAQIIERIKYQNMQDVRASQINASSLAQLFDLDMVLVAGGTQNLANEAAAATFATMWSNEYAMLARIVTSKDIREPGLGRTFHWSGDGSDADGRVESYREEQSRSDIIRVRHDVHEKMLYTSCGYLLSNITT